MRRSFAISFLAVVVAGLFMGWLVPRTAAGASLKEFWFDVPVRSTEGASAQLSCGWHWTACTNNDDGRALDWASYPAPLQCRVYFRGGGRDPSTSFAVRSYGIPRPAPGEFTSCNYNVIMDVYNYSGNPGAWQISLGYTHTTNPGATKYMFYGNPTVYNSGSQVATMATTGDPWGCQSTGSHVHYFECSCSPLGVATNYGGYPYSNSVSCCYDNRSWVHYYNWYD
jgi:hypothetical protein